MREERRERRRVEKRADDGERADAGVVVELVVRRLLARHEHHARRPAALLELGEERLAALDVAPRPLGLAEDLVVGDAAVGVDVLLEHVERVRHAQRADRVHAHRLELRRRRAHELRVGTDDQRRRALQEERRDGGRREEGRRLAAQLVGRARHWREDARLVIVVLRRRQ
jgi:hypothetical protein